MVQYLMRCNVNSLALMVSILGLVVLIIGVSRYFSTIVKNNVPVVPYSLFFALAIGAASGVYSLFLVASDGTTMIIAVAIPALISLFTSGLLTFIITQKNTPIGDIKVKVGDRILPISAMNADGKKFNDTQWQNQRVLLKFYRGSWCLYCCRELTMFEQMKPMFEQYDVKIFGLSGDDVEQANAHRTRDALTHTLLADPQLEVIRRYGVEHQKGVGADSNNIMTLFGLPLPNVHQLKFKSMSIPTSILIDEHGIIVWIDQSDDYRLRANQDKIVSALKANFDG